jgi:hypothetical protein
VPDHAAAGWADIQIRNRDARQLFDMSSWSRLRLIISCVESGQRWTEYTSPSLKAHACKPHHSCSVDAGLWEMSVKRSEVWMSHLEGS